MIDISTNHVVVVINEKDERGIGVRVEFVIYLTLTPNIREELLTFYDFPAKHWQSIRTSNPIESCFATIRHRTKQAKGCLNREGMLHMMFKLSQCAEKK